MTEEGDMRQLLGELITASKERSKQMDRMERTINHLAAQQNEIRIMVFEDRATVRAVKWTVGVVAVGLGALGIDWLQR